MYPACAAVVAAKSIAAPTTGAAAAARRMLFPCAILNPSVVSLRDRETATSDRIPNSNRNHTQTLAEMGVRSGDQTVKRCDIQLFAGAQLHMAHTLAFAFKQAGGIRQRRAMKEPDARMRLVRIDIPKRRIADT